MKDFSMLDQREVPELVLWEKYLVYATAFGIADKVLKQLKIKFPELQDENYMNTHFAYMHIVCNPHTNSNFIDSMSTSIGSSVNYSSGGGSGGGFSGGGGGGRTEVEAAEVVKTLYEGIKNKNGQLLVVLTLLMILKLATTFVINLYTK